MSLATVFRLFFFVYLAFGVLVLVSSVQVFLGDFGVELEFYVDLQSLVEFCGRFCFLIPLLNT